ncbi:MAG: tripartite tricarboxylate transporter TctB family protein [Burkholderiaceae bacterium]
MIRRGGAPGPQTLIGVGLLAVAGVIMAGAVDFPSATGYSGVGSNFLPWVVGLALLVSGVLVIWQARTGGYRDMEEPSGADRGYWPGFCWMSAGLLANAALITTIGFILSCSLCFALAVRGLRHADERAGSPAQRGEIAQSVRDLLIGIAIAAPVYWMFTKLLAINLPGLTNNGWI